MEKKIKMKYLGIGKRRISWSCMGKLYSYVVNEGDVVEVPESQSSTITAFAPFQTLDVVEDGIGFSEKRVTNKEKEKKKSEEKNKDKILNSIQPEDNNTKDETEVVELSVDDKKEEKPETKDEKKNEEIEEGARVKVVDEDNKHNGKVGTVIKITTGGVFRVKLDNDTAKYRRLDNDILELVSN